MGRLIGLQSASHVGRWRHVRSGPHESPPCAYPSRTEPAANCGKLLCFESDNYTRPIVACSHRSFASFCMANNIITCRASSNFNPIAQGRQQTAHGLDRQRFRSLLPAIRIQPESPQSVTPSCAQNHKTTAHEIKSRRFPCQWHVTTLQPLATR